MLSNDLNFLFVGFGLGVIVFFIITEIIYEAKEKKRVGNSVREEILVEKKLDNILFHIILNNNILEAIDNNPYKLKDITTSRCKYPPNDSTKIFYDIGELCNYILSVLNNRVICYDYICLNSIVEGTFVSIVFEKIEKPKKDKTIAPCRRSKCCIYYEK